MATSENEARFQYRRMPAVLRRVSDINPETDVRVRLLGRVIDKAEGAAFIDDGTGTAQVILEENIDKLNTNDVVRVFCRVLPLESGYELRGEIIQDMRALDLDLYRKIVG